MHDVLRRLWQRFGHPEQRVFRITDVDAFDERINVLERRQRDIAARLKLLEQQADPRGWRRHHG